MVIFEEKNMVYSLKFIFEKKKKCCKGIVISMNRFILNKSMNNHFIPRVYSK